MPPAPFLFQLTEILLYQHYTFVRVHLLQLLSKTFLYQQVLEISPQNLGEDVVYLLGEIQLRHLYIVQNRYTPLDITAAVNPKSWKQCAARNPELRVHLRVESVRERQLLWQEGAPVNTVLYFSPQCKACLLLFLI